MAETTPPPQGPERTPDGHHIIVNGRRWRASDPAIPDNLRAELVAELMRARREVRTRAEAARPCVQDAKVSLGERGDPWWEPTPEGTRTRLAGAMRTLLRHRDGATICLSDAARVAGGERWRDLMELARTVAGELTATGEIIGQQHGIAVDLATARGPIRLAPGPSLRR